MESTYEEVKTRMSVYANGSKPHIYLPNGWQYPTRTWACISRASYGYGATPEMAYRIWAKNRSGR